MNYTQVRIKPEYRDKLQSLANDQKRSMTRQLEVMIDETPPKSSDQTAAKEALDNMMLKGIPEAWNPAKFTPRKPLPKGKQ